MTTTAFEKTIAYDRESRDFRATLNGELIGYFPTYSAAEAALDQVAYDILMDCQCATAAELDGGSDGDVMAVEVAAAVVRQHNLIVSEGKGWRVEYDRETCGYLSMINGVGSVGHSASPVRAQTLCHEYMFRQLTKAAA